MIPTVDVGSESMPLLADLDNDGDLDLLMGNKISPDDITSAELIFSRMSVPARRRCCGNAGRSGFAGSSTTPRRPPTSMVTA